MPITEIAVDAIEPFADGRNFGAAGPYVRIRGLARGEIDPQAPENRVIADLDKAPRNPSGMVDTRPISLPCGRRTCAAAAGFSSMT